METLNKEFYILKMSKNASKEDKYFFQDVPWVGTFFYENGYNTEINNIVQEGLIDAHIRDDRNMVIRFKNKEEAKNKVIEALKYYKKNKGIEPTEGIIEIVKVEIKVEENIVWEEKVSVILEDIGKSKEKKEKLMKKFENYISGKKIIKEIGIEHEPLSVWRLEDFSGYRNEKLNSLFIAWQELEV